MYSWEEMLVVFMLTLTVLFLIRPVKKVVRERMG